MGSIFQWASSIGALLALVIVFATWIWTIVSTPKHWWKQGKEGSEGETLGLPKGAIRTFLLLVFVSLSLYVLFTPDVLPKEDKKWVLGTLAGIISFYFASKIVEVKKI